MNVRYTILVIFGLAARFYCDSVDNGTTGTAKTSDNMTTGEDTWNNATDVDETANNSSATEEVANSTTVKEADLNLGYRGLYGGIYYNYNAINPKKLHYIHGSYQSPTNNYYRSQKYYLDGDSDETFDYYLGFGLSKMTDANFQYHDFHYYYHDINRTISDHETIRSDFIIACHPNATFCPENTETICLMNGTIYCMSQFDAVVPCSDNETLQCVNSVVPCVRACFDVGANFENISLPCLSTVVIFDVYEDRGKTLSKVGGTFVIMDAIEEKKRTFCVTVIVDPKPKEDED